MPSPGSGWPSVRVSPATASSCPVQGQPGRPVAPGGTTRAVLAQAPLARPAEHQAPVRGAGRSSPPWRDRTGPAGRGRLVADRRLLAVRPVRGGRLHPRRRQPGGRAHARHARTWPSALASQRHNDQFGIQRKRSSDGKAADHNGGSRAMTSASDRNAMRRPLRRVSDLNADSARRVSLVNRASWPVQTVRFWN